MSVNHVQIENIVLIDFFVEQMPVLRPLLRIFIAANNQIFDPLKGIDKILLSLADRSGFRQIYKANLPTLKAPL